MNARLTSAPAIIALVLLTALTAVVCSQLFSWRDQDASAAVIPPPSQLTQPRSKPLPSTGVARSVPDDFVAAAYRGEIAAQSRMCADGMAHAEMTGAYRDAAYWCALAAESGDAPSQAAYARLFQLGGGVAQDDAQAAAWYEKAIDQQNAYAMYMRGRMALASSDAADHPMGVALLQRASALGDSNARWALQNLGEAPEERPQQPLVR